MKHDSLVPQSVMTPVCNYPVPNYAADPEWYLTADRPVMTRCELPRGCPRANHRPLPIPVRQGWADDRP